MIKKLLLGQRQPVWYSLASIFVSVIMVALLGAIYVKKTVDDGVQRSERKQCGLIIIIDDYFHKTPLRLQMAPRLRRASSTHERYTSSGKTSAATKRGNDEAQA
jgi:hypothetical protein